MSEPNSTANDRRRETNEDAPRGAAQDSGAETPTEPDDTASGRPRGETAATTASDEGRVVEGGGEGVETPTADDDEIHRAEAAEFFVERDENDEIQPVTVAAPGYGDVLVRPMVYGQAERYFGDAGQVADVDAGVVARVLNRHVLDPDLDAYVAENISGYTTLTEQVVKNEMNPWGPQSLMTAVMEGSGLSMASVEMNSDGSAQIDFGDDAEGN